MKTLVRIGWVVMFGLSSGSVLAHDDHPEKQLQKQLPPHEQPAPAHPAGGPSGGSLAEAATNPVANLVQFQLQNVFNGDNHNSDGYGNTFIVQPVIPIALPWEKVPLVITRWTLPYVSTPDLGAGVNRKHGFGDLTALGLFTPKLKTKKAQIGLGYTLGIPTAGDNDFTGSGKWLAGPSFLYINLAIPHIQWGLFGFQEWSFADAQQDREDVSKLSLQPFVTWHLSKGWYIGSPDSPQTYDFKADEWTWALGAQVGRVIKIGKVPAKVFGEFLSNPNNDAGPSPSWTIKFNLTLLFPE